MGNTLTSKEELEFETKATKAKLYRLGKLDEKRELHRSLLITGFLLCMFFALITCVVLHHLQWIFHCGYGVICLIGLFEEQIYAKNKKDITNSLQGLRRF